MAKILHFPSGAAYQPVRVYSKRTHRVRARISDKRRSEEARWSYQFAVQRAGSCRANKGLTDTAARAGLWHSFTIGRTKLVRRFLEDIEPLVRLGRIVIEVDGKLVRVSTPKVA